MDSDVALKTLARATAQFFPQDERKVIEVAFFDDALRRDKAFLAAVAGARANDCLELQPGTYPAFKTKRNVYIRAAIPGTVAIIAKPGQATVESAASCVVLEGLSLQPAPGEAVAVEVRSGSMILKDCDINGAVDAVGVGTSVYLAKCRVSSSGVGVRVTAGSTAAIETSAFLSCGVGVIAEEGTQLVIRHSRFHGCGRNDPTAPGAAVRAVQALVEFSGCRFVNNEKGIELHGCKEVALTACQFDGNTLGSVIATGGSQIKMFAVQFWGKPPEEADHVVLVEAEAEMSCCTVSDISLLEGIVRETSSTTAGTEPLERYLQQLKKLAVSQEIKDGMGAILRNAQSAFEGIEQGLPVSLQLSLQLFHCVFEGGPHLGQRRVAGILANSLKELGFLSTNELVEVAIEDIVLLRRTVEGVAHEANGKAILLHVAGLPNKREAHAFYMKIREVIEAFLQAAGNSSLLILCGERESIRPVLKAPGLAEALGQHVVPFAPYAPGELMRVFSVFCDDHEILLTPRAIEKLLITFYMLDDRRDNRFTTSVNIRNLFEASEQRHRKRCAEQNNYRLPMDEDDLHLPLEQPVNRVLSAQPALVAICPNCQRQSPWFPGAWEEAFYCPNCGHSWHSAWGIWKDSTFLRHLLQREDR